MHGSDNGFPRRPDGDVPFLNGNTFRGIRMFGTATDSRVTSIGFQTTKGRTYGPWGGGGGGTFSVEGNVLSFFGALQNRSVSGIGLWYLPIATAMFTASLESPLLVGKLSEPLAGDDVFGIEGARKHFLVPLCVADKKPEGETSSWPQHVRETSAPWVERLSSYRDNPVNNRNVIPRTKM
jgi:hypothetical protein